MEPETLNELANRAEQILDEFLRLDEARIESIYVACQAGGNVTKRVRELAERAAALCTAEQRPNPPQLAGALAALAQLELPFETELGPRTPCVLLIDQDPNRL